MPYSNAVATAIISLETYLDFEIPIPLEREGDDTGLRAFLDNIRKSVRQLVFTDKLLGVNPTSRDPAKLRAGLAVIAGHERLFEYFAGLHALDTLYRIEKNKERILEIIRLLPATKPPPRSQRYLERVVECFLTGFDDETIDGARRGGGAR